MPRKPTTLVLPLNLGLYLDRHPLYIPNGALQDGRNFRIRKGVTSNTSLGWQKWSPSIGTNDSFTKVLLHLDGADGSTVFADSASGQTGGPPYRRFTGNGGIAIDDDEAQFGSSALFDGTDDYITHLDHADFTLGSDDFTIDCRFNCTIGTGVFARIAGQNDNAGTAASRSFAIFKLDTSDAIGASVCVGGTTFFVEGTTQFSDVTNTGWHHLALVRSGSLLMLFIDGVLEGSVAITGTVNNSTNALSIGITGEETNSFWQGWIDEFRISVGIARWTDDFAVPSAPYQLVFNGPIMLIEEFVSRGQTTQHVIATTDDLYKYDIESDTSLFITPVYTTATVDVSNATPAVVTDNTGTPNWITNDIKAGDEIAFGATTIQDPEGEWYVIASVDAEDQLTLTTAVTGAAFTNVAYTIRRKFTGLVSDQWDTDTFVAPNDGTEDDMMFLTNGVEDIVTYTLQDDFSVYRPALGFKAKQLRIFKSMMLYGNLTIGGESFPTTFINSDVGIPLDVSNGLASEFRVHDGVDQILEMEDLGDNMAFYSERHLTLGQFVGDPLVFIFRQAATGLGPIGPKLVADFGDYHEFIGSDSQYLFDGVSVTEVGKQLWREVLRDRDASRQTLGFHHFDEENGDLIWAIPLASDQGIGDTEAPPEEAFVEHYLEIESESIPDPFSRRAMPFICGGYAVTQEVLTWDEITGTWEEQSSKWNDSILGSAFPVNLMGAEDGFIYTINTSQTADGVVLPSYATGPRRPLGDGRDRGMLRRVYPFARESDGDLQVITRYSDNAVGPNTQSQEDLFDLTLPQEGHFVAPYRRGRFFEIEFRRDDGNPYELDGYDYEPYRGGYR